MFRLDVDEQKVHRQSRIRLLIWAFNTIYFVIGYLYAYYDYSLSTVVALSGAFLVVSLVPMVLAPRWPVLQLWVYGGLLLDLGFNTVAMVLTGGIRSPFFLMFLWIVIGYTTRYGRNMLVPATLLVVVFFSLVVWESGLTDVPPEVGVQYLALVALPAYLQSLLAAVTSAQDEADHANQAKSQFLARMSHEIRTPLAALVGTTELLRRTRLNCEQQGYVHNLKTSANALRSLVDDILDFSKIEAGRLTLDQRPFDLVRIVDEVMAVMTPLAEDKGLALRAEVSAKLPPAVIGDPDRLRQVLFNLVGNAVKFTEQGEIVVRARALSDPPADLAPVRMEVSDTGVGIAEDQLQSVFDGFRQVSGSASPGGTGLGTTISRELVKLMNGRIGVESSPGIGSTFWFEIPWRPASSVPDVAASADEPGHSPNPAPSPGETPALPVLLAEDDAINATVIASLLRAAGYEIDVVPDGEQALHALHTRCYGAAFLDRRMPGMTGIEVARRWRETEPPNQHLPLVALTADATIEDEQESRTAGFDEFLVKPVSPQRLVEVARAFTG